MPAHRLLSIAAAAALALVAIPTTLAGQNDPWDPCAPAAQPPAAPFPLQLHRDQAGVHLAWHDDLNPLQGIALDHYLVFRSPLQTDLRMEQIGEVEGTVHEFLDQQARAGDFVYWVAGHNCVAVGQESNPASTSAQTCADWGLTPTAIPPLQWVTVDTGCPGGTPCVLVIHLFPTFYVDRVGCDVRGV